MTMTHRCEVTPVVTALAPSDQPVVTGRMAVFLADELLPMIAGLWPASSAQLNANANGSAMAYGLVLRGHSPKAIREVVLGMVSDVERIYAPRPGEIRDALSKGKDVTGVTVSMAALAMMAKARQLRGEIGVGESALAAEISAEADKARASGVTVTGGLC